MAGRERDPRTDPPRRRPAPPTADPPPPPTRGAPPARTAPTPGRRNTRDSPPPPPTVPAPGRRDTHDPPPPARTAPTPGRRETHDPPPPARTAPTPGRGDTRDTPPHSTPPPSAAENDGCRTTFTFPQPDISPDLSSGHRVMFLSDQEVFSIVPSGSIAPAFWVKGLQYLNKILPVFSPPVPPSTPAVPAHLFELIQGKFNSISESVKIAADFVRSVKESCIKNGQTIARLEQRIEKMENRLGESLENRLEESLEIAKSSLELVKESKAMHEETYALVKKQLQLISTKAEESKIDRIKRYIEMPEKILSIIRTMVGYVAYIEALAIIIEEIYGKKPPQAEAITTVLESMIDDIEKFQISESSFDHIGGFCADLLNGIYEPENKFSVTASDSVNGSNCLVTSSLTKGKNSEVILVGSLRNELEVKFVTDMSSTGILSLVGDVNEGLRETLYFGFPNLNSKMRLMYQHPEGGICVSIENSETKTFDVSGIYGLKWFSIGGDMKFDATTNKFLRYDIAAGFDSELYSASLSLTNRCETFRGTLAKKLWPGTSVGAEVTHSTSSKKKSLSLGLSHEFNKETLIKLKVCSDFEGTYVGAAALKYLWNERSSVSASFQLEHKENKVQPKFGLCFSFQR